ncbi:hypothetical protein PAXINDRAFT_40640, partial [Paxillus involutus ATCC 200175]
TPLHSACFRGHMNIIKLLLEQGADVNALGKCCGTPLHAACSGGDIDIVDLLLQKGADMHLQLGHSEDFKGFGDPATPLHFACYVELLLQKDVDLQVAVQSKSLYTALHFASMQGHSDVVKLLLE